VVRSHVEEPKIKTTDQTSVVFFRPIEKQFLGYISKMSQKNRNSTK